MTVAMIFIKTLNRHCKKCLMAIVFWASSPILMSFTATPLLSKLDITRTNNSERKYLSVDGTSYERMPKRNFRSSQISIEQLRNADIQIDNSEKNNVTISTAAIDHGYKSVFKEVRRTLENETKTTFEINNKLSNYKRKLSSQPEYTLLDTDDELLRRYNVTPNATWLKQFYRIGANSKRKTLFDFPFIINGSGICETSPDPFLIIMVLSIHDHIVTRNTIRNTWGRAANPGEWPDIGVLHHDVKLIFLFGRGRTVLTNGIVKDESKRYNDVVQADFKDSYFNLSYKVITGIRWVAEFCPKAKYILKADQDVFVHVPNLIRALSQVQGAERSMFLGSTNENALVLRKGRWKVTAKTYPFPAYPTYTQGNTYVIPGSRATEIYETARYLDYMNIEDVFVTGIIRTIIGADIRKVAGFTKRIWKRPSPCQFKNSIKISATRMTNHLQNVIWNGLTNTSITDCYMYK